MDAVRWQRLEALCAAALDRPPGERPAYLDQACGDDRELRREAAALLAAADEDPGFLERPLVDWRPLGERVGPADAPLPEAIGPYRVIRLLGRGGMGEVYLAERTADGVTRSVALKVIRRGMVTDEVLERFRLERRILASLDHPNIARLLDAGATDDGRPYFVMESVEGRPIDEYCDAHQLTVSERLSLFQVICGAVQHAHQALVVHRDLKPRNILVTAGGVPKLLDFGIGKVLTGSESLGPGLETRTEIRLLTPEYAAPEQVAGQPVTTATDVYGLGILLYELLTGRHPYLFGGESLAAIEHAVRETLPPRPSTAVTGGPAPGEASRRRRTDSPHLRRRLQGDLDNIVLKALRKEPDRRYGSAAALAEDIQRHHDGLPVRARPDTWGYRSRKFVRRNAAWVAAAVIAFLGLTSTTAVTLVQSRRVAEESARVTRERDKALEVRGFLLEMFGATGADQAVGDTVSVRGLLDRQAASLEREYGDRPELQADMMEVLAEGYDRLGLYRQAEPLARKALAFRRTRDDPAALAASLNLTGWITHELGRSKAAEPMLREAVAIRRTSGTPGRADFSRSLNDLGVVLNALGRYAEADTVLTEALAIRRQDLGDEHLAVGITANNLAAAYYYQSRIDDAIRVQELALRALRATVGPDHQRSVVALSNLAAFKRAAGQWTSAEADYRDLLARQTRLQGRDHPVTARVELSLATAVMERAAGPGADSVRAEAEGLLREALASFRTHLGNGHPQVGMVLDRLASVVIDRGRLAEAESLENDALRILRAKLGNANPNTASAVQRLALVRWRQGSRERAVQMQRDAVASLVEAVGDRHPETGKARAVLCDYLVARRDDLTAARDVCAAAATTLQTAPAGYRPLALLPTLRLAEADLALGRSAVADSILGAARPTVTQLRPDALERRILDSLEAAVRDSGPGPKSATHDPTGG